MTEVVAALIWRGNRFLACQRPAHKARGLLWEFVGGKVEPGETKAQALMRECREELDVDVRVGDVFMELEHVYPDMTVHLTLFHAEIAQGAPKLLEHNAIKWVTTGEMDDLAFCPADEAILRKLRAEYPEPVMDTVRRLSGDCACGRRHGTAVRDVRIEKGLRHRVGDVLRENGFSETLLLVADEHTRRAAEGLEESLRGFSVEYLLYPDLRVATMEEVARVEERLMGRDVSVLSVGTGSLNDICRLAAARQGKKLALFATAPSMDGFASYSAPIVAKGFKASYPAKSPEVILGDTEVLAKAPAALKSAGFGDMIAKYIAVADWKIAALLTGETYCPRVAALSLRGADALMDMAERVTLEDEETAGQIFSALLLTGIGMSFMENSRPASGSEHIVAHLIECKELPLGVVPDLHGEDVGVCTLLMLRLYERLRALPRIHARREALDWEKIFAYYGDMREDVEKLNFPESVTASIAPALLEEKWPEIREILGQLPAYETCLAAMERAGCKRTWEDIGKPKELIRDCVRFSPYMRRRVTLLRLLNMIEEGDALWQEIV